MRDVYPLYRLSQTAGIDPLAQRSVHNHLSDLRMLGILSAEENRTGSRGNYYSYALDVPFSSAMEALSDVLALSRPDERADQNHDVEPLADSVEVHRDEPRDNHDRTRDTVECRRIWFHPILG